VPILDACHRTAPIAHAEERARLHPRITAPRAADAADAPPRDAMVATKNPSCPKCGRPTTLLTVGHWANVYECPACGERVSGVR
jgi:ribosomal protein S27AE